MVVDDLCGLEEFVLGEKLCHKTDGKVKVLALSKHVSSSIIPLVLTISPNKSLAPTIVSCVKSQLGLVFLNIVRHFIIIYVLFLLLIIIHDIWKI